MARSWHEQAYELNVRLAAAEQTIESQAATINIQTDKLKSCCEENDQLRFQLAKLLEYYRIIDDRRS